MGFFLAGFAVASEHCDGRGGFPVKFSFVERTSSLRVGQRLLAYLPLLPIRFRMCIADNQQSGANEMTWFVLGAIYERQKIYDRAEMEFKKALAVNPRDAAVLNYYGYMLGDLGIRLDEAQSLVQRALKEEPNSGAYLDSLGWIYFRENKLADAEATLRKAVQFESHDATIRSHLGDVYAKSGRMDLAATQWEKSLEEWRHSLPADVENDKVAEVEKKLSEVKHRVAQKSSPEDAKPQ